MDADRRSIRDEIDFRDLLPSPAASSSGTRTSISSPSLAGARSAVRLEPLNAMGKNAIAPRHVARFVGVRARIFRCSHPQSFRRSMSWPAQHARRDSLAGQGRDLFQANCVSCHGDNGLGDGPAGLSAESEAAEFPHAGRVDERAEDLADLQDACRKGSSGTAWHRTAISLRPTASR